MASSDSEAESYEVAQVLDSRKKGRSTEFLVRWKGFGEAEDSWEPEKNLKRAATLIAAYKKKNKSPARSRSKGRSRSKSRGRSTGRSQSRGRSGSRSRQAATKQTKQTTTVTKTETKAVAQTPSPVVSPRRTGRRLLRSEIESSSKAAQEVIETQSSSTRVTRSMQQRAIANESRASKFVKSMRYDIPIVILVSCLLFIAVSFAVQNLK